MHLENKPWMQRVRTMYVVKCTMYNVQCTMNEYTTYNVKCTMYNVSFFLTKNTRFCVYLCRMQIHTDYRVFKGTVARDGFLA
jgi:hypothetical protein